MEINSKMIDNRKKGVESIFEYRENENIECELEENILFTPQSISQVFL